MSIPQLVHWSCLGLCLVGTRSLPIPWFRAMLVLSLLEAGYRPGPVSRLVAFWLCLLLLARLAASLEAYSLVTLSPPWKFGILVFWPLVFAALGITLVVVSNTGMHHEWLYVRRYVQIWMGIFLVLAVSFAAAFRPWPCLHWRLIHAFLVTGMVGLQAMGSLRYLVGLSGDGWEQWNRQLYLLQAAVLLCLTLLGLRGASAFGINPRSL